MSDSVPARVMYHTTSAPHRSLMRHGLDWQRAGAEPGPGCEDQPAGNYLWPTLAAAEAWARYGLHPRIYRVDVAGIRLKRDPFWDNLPEDDADYVPFVGPRGGAPRAYYTPDPIEPHRLVLLKTVQLPAAA